MKIDGSMDFRSDIKVGQDPDKYSNALRKYHKKLWSKTLPNGKQFSLSDEVSGRYLYHNSEVGEFFLSSDQIFTSFVESKRLRPIIELLPEGRVDFILDQLHTIGGFIVFPSNKINKKSTINGARGLNARIRDRFDITLECIRRHYDGLDSPLAEALERYRSFFNLFGNFRGYVEFFHLQDLVSEDFSRVNFFMLFDENFPTNPCPSSIKEYESYISNMINFVSSRSHRISSSIV